MVLNISSVKIQVTEPSDFPSSEIEKWEAEQMDIKVWSQDNAEITIERHDK